jgi:hypothetical protein
MLSNLPYTPLGSSTPLGKKKDIKIIKSENGNLVNVQTEEIKFWWYICNYEAKDCQVCRGKDIYEYEEKIKFYFLRLDSWALNLTLSTSINTSEIVWGNLCKQLMT